MDLFQYHADAVKFRVAKSTENYLIQVYIFIHNLSTPFAIYVTTLMNSLIYIYIIVSKI